MSAVTLQVQLCEYRQFRHSVARLKYGLAEDPKMRNDMEAGQPKAADFIKFDEQKNVMAIEFQGTDKVISSGVCVNKVADCNKNVAKRVAFMMISKLKSGSSQKDAESFRDELLKEYTGGEDVPEDSEAWHVCRISGISAGNNAANRNPVCSFEVVQKSGAKVHVQTTVGACGGSYLQAERIARLCWQKLKAGESKEKVLQYREKLYKGLTGTSKQENRDKLCAALGVGTKRAAVEVLDPAPSPKKQRVSDLSEDPIEETPKAKPVGRPPKDFAHQGRECSIQFDERKNVVTLEEKGAGTEMISVKVPVKAAGCSKGVATRVAELLKSKIRYAGMTQKDAENYKDELLKEYSGGEDVPENSEAWKACKIAALKACPHVPFDVVLKNGTRVHFQTTARAAGDSILQAERIARLCYQKLKAGEPKEKVEKYRAKLYETLSMSTKRV